MQTVVDTKKAYIFLEVTTLLPWSRMVHVIVWYCQKMITRTMTCTVVGVKLSLGGSGLQPYSVP